MPLVEVTLFAGRTDEQKAEIAELVSEALIRVGNAAPDSVLVIFRDSDRRDWFRSAQLTRDDG